MGNICSRGANPSDPFSQPGRVLGTSSTPTPAAAPKASVPPKVGGPGRTLGGGPPAGDARSKAAEAAQKRAEAQADAANRGKLHSQLVAQKAQTPTQTLTEASRAERAAREADQASRAQRWD